MRKTALICVSCNNPYGIIENGKTKCCGDKKAPTFSEYRQADMVWHGMCRECWRESRLSSEEVIAYRTRIFVVKNYLSLGEKIVNFIKNYKLYLKKEETHVINFLLSIPKRN